MAVRYDIFTTREDGEVMLDELMSADWTALQVNVMPLDSSGAYTPLVSGTVSVKASPFGLGITGLTSTIIIITAWHCA